MEWMRFRAEHLIDSAEEILRRPTRRTRVAGQLMADRAIDRGKHHRSVALAENDSRQEDNGLEFARSRGQTGDGMSSAAP